ncbi:kanosamine 6-kinase [Herbihabitans rhizosphaerae]|uniref:Kanosamine 6-kinase n=1 Tax=Herbihabitans rhizosphaerae TaxID=1872711 RepID=A0A4Q7KKD4_9PSEU|nr:kanosamine 6-kinase [Herbihabitans rhizosphaerae]
MGGTKVAIRVEDGATSRETTFLWVDAGDPARDVAALSDRLTTMFGESRGSVRAVGVAMPATLNRDGRVIAWPGRPSWVGIEVHAALDALFPGTVVRYADDGDLAAVAEADAIGARDVVYLGVGTGVGGGVVLDGRSLPGPDAGSCEVGHLIVDRSGAVCDCGRRGCLQGQASGPATLRRAAESRGEEVTFFALRDAWLARAPWAVSAVRDSCASIAAAVIGLAELVGVPHAVIGGGFASSLPGFTDEVATQIADLRRAGVPTPRVTEAVFGGLSSLRGAVLLARRSPTAFRAATA